MYRKTTYRKTKLSQKVFMPLILVNLPRNNKRKTSTIWQFNWIETDDEIFHQHHHSTDRHNEIVHDHHRQYLKREYFLKGGYFKCCLWQTTHRTPSFPSTSFSRYLSFLKTTCLSSPRTATESLEATWIPNFLFGIRGSPWWRTHSCKPPSVERLRYPDGPTHFSPFRYFRPLYLELSKPPNLHLISAIFRL